MENEQRHCYAMIETAEAFDDAPAIAALPCVDGLFIGPADLSVARGRGAFAAPDADLADLRHIATVCYRRRKALGDPGGKSKACARLRWSYRRSFVTLGDDLSALALGFSTLRATL